jgi:DNA-binding NtrC family response regulator
MMKEHQVSPAVDSSNRLSANPASLPHRILLVDDDDDFRQLNAKVLMRAGYEVDVAEDGAVAWQALNAGRYDLLITDNSMPKVTGVELLAKIHATGMALPTILVTSDVPEHEFIHRPEIRPGAILLKPYLITRLLETVKRMLHQSPSAAGQNVPLPGPSAPPPDRLQL